MPFPALRKITALFFFFAWWVFLVSPAGAEVEVLFSPERAIKEHVLKEVESTTSTLDLAIHEITSSDMAQAFLKAKGRGVKVRMIADSKQAKMKSSKITYLIHQGILVKVLGGKGEGLMNHRFAILDGKKVITGSYDWSRFLESSSYENVLILTDSDVVASYQKEFDRLWREKRVVK
jgi:phosphatidylserine/phosphatidylglycerophosphate/cardiolipin synthase-like enzyme